MAACTSGAPEGEGESRSALKPVVEEYSIKVGRGVVIYLLAYLISLYWLCLDHCTNIVYVYIEFVLYVYRERVREMGTFNIMKN